MGVKNHKKFENINKNNNFEEKKDRLIKGTFLLDANFFVHIEKDDFAHAKSCRKVVSFKSENIRFATTQQIVEELLGLHLSKIRIDIDFYCPKKICPTILKLQTNYRKKQLSLADKSLLQTVKDNNEIQGIITYDKDFNYVSSRYFLKKLTGRKIFIGTSEKFLVQMGHRW